MNVVLPVLIIAGISSALILALIIIVIASIHASERRMSFSREPRTWPEMVTRRVLGAHSELPGSLRHSRPGRRKWLNDRPG
jgi:hypothetical protein